jgi:hypothetical protein
MGKTDATGAVTRRRYTAELQVRNPNLTKPVKVVIIRRESTEVDGVEVANVVLGRSIVQLDSLLDRKVMVNGTNVSGAQVVAWLQAIGDQADDGFVE